MCGAARRYPSGGARTLETTLRTLSYTQKELGLCTQTGAADGALNPIGSVEPPGAEDHSQPNSRNHATPREDEARSHRR